LLEAYAPTGRLRDLDVFLLDRPNYEVLLPAEFSDGLDKLFQHVSKERQQAQKALVHKLRTKVYRDNMVKIASLLEAAPDFEGEQSREAVKMLAQKRVTSHYRKVSKTGKTIDDNTPDEEVHQLRKECKKLRYLMEFFAELFPKKTMKTLIRQLKDLQDTLGQFNDYSVQQRFLMRVAEREKSKSVLAAINGLIAVLHQRQKARASQRRLHLLDPARRGHAIWPPHCPMSLDDLPDPRDRGHRLALQLRDGARPDRLGPARREDRPGLGLDLRLHRRHRLADEAGHAVVQPDAEPDVAQHPDHDPVAHGLAVHQHPVAIEDGQGSGHAGAVS